MHKALGRFQEAIRHYENALKIEKNRRFQAGIEKFIERGGPVDKKLSPRQRLQ